MELGTLDGAVMKLITAGIAITILVVLLARSDAFNKITTSATDNSIAFMKAAAGA